MDMMILVVDITKGIQVQTAECLVIGEITVDKLLVVLNKVDLIAAEKRDKIVEKAKKRVAQTLKITTFKDTKILPVSSKTRLPPRNSRRDLLKKDDQEWVWTMLLKNWWRW